MFTLYSYFTVILFLSVEGKLIHSIADKDNFFHNSPGAARYRGTPHFQIFFTRNARPDFLSRPGIPVTSLLLGYDPHSSAGSRFLLFLQTLYLFVQRQHSCIQLGNHLRALHQFSPDMFRRFSFEFIIDFMFQTRPEIHGYRPDLDLHLHIHNTV